MMEPTFFFSVVIPTHERAESLAACLRCLQPGVQRGMEVAGGAPKYEVLVGDDGASSDSAAMMAREFPWARRVEGPRRGPAANRNSAAREARGEWLVFTDDDCLPSLGWLAAFATAIAHGHAQVLEGRTTTGGAAIGALETAPVNEHGGHLWSCNLAIQRGLFSKIGGFDENFPSPHLEDVDLRWRLEKREEAMEFVPEAKVVHPPRPVTSIWRQARGHESSFYFAKKWGCTPAQAGFGLRSLLRTWLGQWRRCRNAWEALLVTGRHFVEGTLLLARVPFWRQHYRRK